MTTTPAFFGTGNPEGGNYAGTIARAKATEKQLEQLHRKHEGMTRNLSFEQLQALRDNNLDMISRSSIMKAAHEVQCQIEQLEII